MAAPLVVGIDLGTTHTVVAWSELAPEAEPAIFPIAQQTARGEIDERALLPSFLYAPTEAEREADPWGDAPWVVGAFARSRGQEVPGRLVSSAKSWLSHGKVDRTAAILPWGAPDDADDLPRLSPVEASSRILRHVRSAWNAASPEQPLEAQQVVLTVPASFDQAARALTVRAAEEAGLSVRLLEEPQAAFYDAMRRVGLDELDAMLGSEPDALVLVCDVGGGTTDLTLIRLGRTDSGAVDVTRVAVGRHLLLGGDNLDLALAHLCEQRLVTKPKKLEPAKFGQLVLACRDAKERLLAADAPDSVAVRLLVGGSSLVGGTLSTDITKEEVERIVLDGFLPAAKRGDRPKERGRGGLVAFGLPYEHDAAITRHLASFFDRHAPDVAGPRGVLFNGGLFHAPPVAARITEIIASWSGPELAVLPQPDPDLAVARGAVAYGLALAGHGLRIGGGTAHGYYVAIESRGARRSICVVPRGAKEGERHHARPKGLALTVGKAVRFELYASDAPSVHAPGEVVAIDDEHFELLPPVATTFEASDENAEERVGVAIEGELSAIGTVDLACVEAEPGAGSAPRRYALAFELRGAEVDVGRGERPKDSDPQEPSAPTPADSLQPPSGHPTSLYPATRGAQGPQSSVRALGSRFDEAVESIQRVFGKGRKDVKERESKDLVRELERLLGERKTWDLELCRALFDVIGPKHKARKRSPDHERMYWLLSGFCLRPGFGHALDPQRINVLTPLFEQGLTFGSETRGWEMFFIAWRRVAGGLKEPIQLSMRDLLDPFLAPEEAKLKRPKGFKPVVVKQLLETASWLERAPAKRRAELGGWLLDRTWTDRDPQLWQAIGRLGARVPVYASIHHVVAPRAVERWLDHLLREKWDDIPTAPRAAMLMARATGDRARDVSDTARAQVAKRLEAIEGREAWAQSVREIVEVETAERAELFGEELPVGLELVDAGD